MFVSASYLKRYNLLRKLAPAFLDILVLETFLLSFLTESKHLRDIDLVSIPKPKFVEVREVSFFQQVYEDIKVGIGVTVVKEEEVDIQRESLFGDLFMEEDTEFEEAVISNIKAPVKVTHHRPTKRIF